MELVAQFREMETKTAKGFELKREEILGKIEEGQIQAIIMGEKLEEEIGFTSKKK